MCTLFFLSFGMDPRKSSTGQGRHRWRCDVTQCRLLSQLLRCLYNDVNIAFSFSHSSRFAGIVVGIKPWKL